MFYITKDNVIVLYDEDRKRLVGTLAFMPQYEGLEVLETNENETIVDGELLTLEEAEEIKKQKEAERIALLNLTAADVERAIYKAKGMDFEDIVTQLETLKQVDGDNLDIDVKALKIELRANNFYRGNPYIDAVGNLLGFTSEQLNEFFETNDYTKLITE